MAGCRRLARAHPTVTAREWTAAASHVDTRSLFFVSFGDIWGLQWYGGISLFACSILSSCVLLFFGFGDFMDARRALLLFLGRIRSRQRSSGSSVVVCVAALEFVCQVRELPCLWRYCGLPAQGGSGGGGHWYGSFVASVVVVRCQGRHRPAPRPRLILCRG